MYGMLLTPWQIIASRRDLCRLQQAAQLPSLKLQFLHQFPKAGRPGLGAGWVQSRCRRIDLGARGLQSRLGRDAPIRAKPALKRGSGLPPQPLPAESEAVIKGQTAAPGGSIAKTGYLAKPRHGVRGGIKPTCYSLDNLDLQPGSTNGPPAHPDGAWPGLDADFALN
jgi:hypothetical protein